MLPVTYAWQLPPGSSGLAVPSSPILVLLAPGKGAFFQTLFTPLTLAFYIAGFYLNLDLLLDLPWIFFNHGCLCRGLPSSIPSSPSTSTAAAAVSTHRSCPCCTRRMSSMKYGRNSLCFNCRDVQCSLAVRCSECQF